MSDAGFASGFTVKLGVIPTFPTMVSGAPVVAAQLKRIGVTAEIENVEYAVWIKRWQAKDFDLTMNTTPGYADPDTAFFRALHSTKGQNWNSWSVPDLDAMLEEGRRTMDPKKRKEIYDRVQVMILENVRPRHRRRADDRRRRHREPGDGGGAEAVLRPRPAVVAAIRTLGHRPGPGRSRHVVAHRQARGHADPRAVAGDDRADVAGRGLRADARHPGRDPVREPPRSGDRQRHPRGHVARPVRRRGRAGRDP